ncbi:LOW QUALITY PROTEIN: SH2 domain-containing adapter protein D [Lagopus muta]|uniref:LOW QUALITY PROTEIN: SH2 domain-containing adapter protein D n=1 Tax=Lagopus muta TaxID=64668 RepID=UPI00209D3EBB|nr:LOW QUALITY PROTEIN: SH2 domain-containing adapter protein D [Lagopus muta]
MAKWLREYLGRGARRSPPRPPQPDYSGGERRPHGTGTGTASPRHRLVRVGGPGRLEQGPNESEYSEPFDQDSVPEGGNEDPRDAAGRPRHGEGQRVKTQQGPKLYDTPCEGWEKVGEGTGGGAARDSRLPRDDERPADEYDQPWEWKKDHISRAFAVQFESPERSPSLSRQPARPPRPPPGTRPICPPSPGHVDTSLPLEKQVWYHGPIGRAGAETLLALCREGSFLVRDCETSPEDYSLSLRSSHGFVHVKLTRTREQHFVLGRAGAAFPSVPEAVRHYTARALPVRGARHLSLLYPVAAQPP